MAKYTLKDYIENAIDDIEEVGTEEIFLGSSTDAVESEDDLEESEDSAVESESEDDFIDIIRQFACLPEFGVKLTTGIYMSNYDGEATGDFSVTVIYDINEKDYEKFLYWEQDPPDVSLWNWLRSQDKLDDNKFKTLEDLGEVECFLESHPFGEENEEA